MNTKRIIEQLQSASTEPELLFNAELNASIKLSSGVPELRFLKHIALKHGTELSGLCNQKKETLKGQIDDCSCDVDNVDYFNNVKIYPRLRSLLINDYFRYFIVNLDRKCPFWEDDSKCSLRDCSVQACTEDQVPPGLKGNYKRKPDHKYSKSANNQENCEDDLGALNNTIR
ncbi:Ero1-like protein [Nymphon striatum]|nr:Ero1-like protein [Nymphon striatum]